MTRRKIWHDRRQPRRADTPSHCLAGSTYDDPPAIEKELERVFDICHRCFNLCDAFPRLFDLVDSSPTQELDSVDPKDFKSVIDACTLCDLCFMTKCPYVPPHEFNLDFPHLMLRSRANGKARFNRSRHPPADGICQDPL